jgi:hypothetical protein
MNGAANQQCKRVYAMEDSVFDCAAGHARPAALGKPVI